MIYLDIGGGGPGLIRAEEARIPVTDRGFLYGDGLFETIFVRDGRAPTLDEHLVRLRRSAAALRIPFERFDLAGAVGQVLRSVASGEHAMRITLSRGASQQRGFEAAADCRPTLLITSVPYRRRTGTLTAITASIRVNPQSPLTAHKTLSALEKVIARSEAAAAGCDEALLLNLAGRVAEGAATNLFLCRNGVWVTPPTAEGCLPGVMRARMIALTNASEQSVLLADLFAADGVFMTNSLIGAARLLSLDGKPLPNGGAAPILDRLLGM